MCLYRRGSEKKNLFVSWKNMCGKLNILWVLNFPRIDEWINVRGKLFLLRQKAIRNKMNQLFGIFFFFNVNLIISIRVSGRNRKIFQMKCKYFRTSLEKIIGENWNIGKIFSLNVYRVNCWHWKFNLVAESKM